MAHCAHSGNRCARAAPIAALLAPTTAPITASAHTCVLVLAFFCVGLSRSFLPVRAFFPHGTPPCGSAGRCCRCHHQFHRSSPRLFCTAIFVAALRVLMCLLPSRFCWLTLSILFRLLLPMLPPPPIAFHADTAYSSAESSPASTNQPESFTAGNRDSAGSCC